MAFRLVLLTSFFGLIYGILGFNLYKLQVVKNDYYVKRAEAQSEISRELELRRGQIFFTDRYGKKIPAALNKDYPVIYAVPKEIDDPEETYGNLNLVLNKILPENIKTALSNKQSFFRMIVDKATKDDLRAVSESKIDGVYAGAKQHRFYPFEKLASHALGFVGVNENKNAPSGLYGIEGLYDDLLSRGVDVELTLDRNIQAHAEEILQSLVEKFNATGGTVIVQEPKTGSIIALANLPDFNPNSYSASPLKNFLNPAVQSVYEPGSVFKPFTMAAGIESGKLTPETTYYDAGKITLNGKTITNWDKKSYGNITMTNVIERSVNTGAVYAESLTGHSDFYAFLKRLGFGSKTGVDLPDEVSGSLKNLERKDARAIDFATASFGQGTAVTPMQLINAFSSIANGGLLMRPYVKRTEGPKVISRDMKEETAKQVTAMMESAVVKAQVAKVASYRVAGKTGTAQIPDFNRGGYTEEYIHSYVGFAPISAPRFVALLKLDRPSAILAGQTVVPAFRELAEFILTYYNVSPDDLPELEASQSQ